jgi:hypothetical protein
MEDIMDGKNFWHGLRGGCDGMPLEPTGEFTGYNTAATMQVGLWISNDGEYIEAARHAAADGPKALRLYLLAAMLLAPPASAPWQTGEAMTAAGGTDAVDWAQICYGLVFVKPDGEGLTDWQLAYRQHQAQAERIAMQGVEG